MKLLYVLNSNSVTGGATKSFIAMLHQVLQNNYEALVICPSTEGIFEYLHTINGIRVETIKYRPANYPLNRNFVDKIKWIPRLMYTYVCNYLAVKKIIKLAKDWEPDIIHENTSVTDVGYKVAKKLDIPCVTHIREYGDKDFNLNLYNIDVRLTDPLVYTIPITKDIARYRKVDKNKRSFQIYNGILREEDIRYSSQKSNYFLFAGRVEAPKGIEDLLEAYSIYCKKTTSPFVLKIAGEAYDKDYLQRLKDKTINLNIFEYVEWMGGQNIDKMAKLYYNAAATIIPSLFEGLGRVMPEAMANGCLCIGRDTGGTREQFEEGKRITGQEIGFRFHDVRDLGNLLISISDTVCNNNPYEVGGSLHTIIMNSQKAIRQNFTIDVFGKKLISAYDAILKLKHYEN